ncbi:unnamed protein product [Adineta steineri]|uniref:Uncharacterized protein n=1 Tax=Adineta steineri TaxID=433720 RepID=A0A818W2H9_9BILA|nr:unnamed protein product [Adineta steineri]CAF3718639.1 unnamed protein product [Adineta steineri]
MCSIKRCCRNCFPNGCCGFCKPPPTIQKQIDTEIHLKKAVKATEIPYGFIKFYPGAATANNTYTCPMLAVHLYRHREFNADMAQDNRTITFDGRNRQQTHQGEQNFKREQHASAEEEVIMVPLEDVIRIRYKAEVKKAIQADIKSHLVPVHGPSDHRCDTCCASIINCCRKNRACCCCREKITVAPHVENTTIITDADPNRATSYVEEDVAPTEVKEGCCTRCGNLFRCWCCGKKKLLKFIKRTNTKAQRQAERVVTMTIEYNKYSNLDSATHTCLLSEQDRFAYYKHKFQADLELTFYLINDQEYEQTNFDAKKNEAETLCRAVMQLKGMKKQYPSEDQLEKILNQAHQRTFGVVFHEPALQLESARDLPRIGGGRLAEHLPPLVHPK